MIIDFSVSNFRSISEEQSLSMTAAKFVSKKKEVDSQNTIVIDEKLTLLKSKAIYGANASGKSNMIKALKAFIRLVDGSVKEQDCLKLFVERFLLSSEYQSKPTSFQLIFLLDGTKYRYGFEVTAEKVISEWLFGTPGKKEVKFFIRSENAIEINHVTFVEGIKIKDMVKDTALFLSSINLFNGKISNKITYYISRILIADGGQDENRHTLAMNLLELDESEQRISAMMKVADIGIEGLVKAEFQNDGLRRSVVLSMHKSYDVTSKETVDHYFTFLEHESEGTQRMFQLSALILWALDQGRPLIIDEFDASFHPLLTKTLVQLFNSELNNNKAQFIFATHDTNLLNPELLRKDQVCFVEKDQKGASSFYSLAEFKGVRNDASIEKDYISGRFGAIPFIGNFNPIFGENSIKS